MTEMEYRYMGRSGLQVSAIGLGSWLTYGFTVPEEDKVFECMNTAFEAGVNFFDNAETYGLGEAEVVMGNVFRRGNWRRSEYVIATKLFFGSGSGERGPNVYGLSRKHIVEGLDASLKRLQLPYVDVLLCHRPDLHTPIEETVRAINHVIAQGKVFYWGTSEWEPEQIREAISVSKELGLIGPIVEQPQYSMLHRTRVEKEYKTLLEKYGTGLTTYSPLAMGLLSGKYSRDKFDENSRLGMLENFQNDLKNGKGMNGLEMKDFNGIFDRLDALKVVASELECSLAQLALAWCMKNTHVSSVITGSSKPEQVVENIKALAVVPKLTTAIMERIDEILKNRPEQYKDWLQDAKAVQREVIAMKKAQAAEEAANVNKEEKAEDK